MGWIEPEDLIDLDPKIIKDVELNSQKMGTTTMFSPLTPWDWQLEAFNSWKNNGYVGTIVAATGIGKTYVGLMAIQQFPDESVVIVTPTVHLQQQWTDFLTDDKLATKDDIGYVGGYGKQSKDKRITIAIVNSIRYKDLVKGLLIMDEMHRYGSKCNITFLQQGKFKRILGLTATPERTDMKHKELLCYAPQVYELKQKQAIVSDLLCHFKVVNLAVTLTEEEQKEYEKAEVVIKKYFPYFKNNFKAVQETCRPGNPNASMAGELLRAFNKRKSLIINSERKIEKTIELILSNISSKIIVFCELVTTANQIARILRTKGVTVARYHSGMKPAIRKEMLVDFKSDKYRIMVAVRCLDEGINVPDCDVGIIAAGSGVKRQMIQRLGRILRKRPEKKALMFQVYVKDTQDVKWVRGRSSGLTGVADSIEWK